MSFLSDLREMLARNIRKVTDEARSSLARRGGRATSEPRLDPSVLSAGVFLRAFPNPVPEHRTTLAWNTKGAHGGEVTLLASAGKEEVLARGAMGTITIDWISRGPYRFRLYEVGTGQKRVLAEIEVVRDLERARGGMWSSSRGADHYDARIDVESTSSHAQVLRLVGRDQRVLELGTAGGHVTRALVERGCRVVGVELERQAATRAAKACERMIVGNLDSLDLSRAVGKDRFDVVLAADVLEHLKDPLSVLSTIRGLLRPDGFVVASVPNVAHGSVRLALLQGRFAYDEWGLLDFTHLRFFTRASLLRLFELAGYHVDEIERHEEPFGGTEVLFDPNDVSPATVAQLERDIDARTYQFIVRARPI